MTEVPNVALHLPAFEHANLQRGVDAYLAAHSPDATWFGIAGNRHFSTVIDMLAEAANNRRSCSPSRARRRTAVT